jgi:hypothetical protein
MLEGRERPVHCPARDDEVEAAEAELARRDKVLVADVVAEPPP